MSWWGEHSDMGQVPKKGSPHRGDVSCCSLLLAPPSSSRNSALSFPTELHGRKFLLLLFENTTCAKWGRASREVHTSLR